jgi:hypothetical protein
MVHEPRARSAFSLQTISSLVTTIVGSLRVDRCILEGRARQTYVGSSSQANYLLRNTAMDDSIGGS